MANPEHLEILKQGVKVWNEWRQNNPFVSPNLSQENIGGSNLMGINFSETNLVNSNLSGASLQAASVTKANLIACNLSKTNLNDANFSESTLIKADISEAFFINANLYKVNFREANLIKANLTRANLEKAYLGEADLNQAKLNNACLREANLCKTRLNRTELIRTDFSEAVFDGADISGAIIGWAIFGNNNLSVLEGLDSVSHRGPSTIGVDTLYRSAGRIPEGFLRGCGLPDEFITYLPSLLGVQQAIQFYSCFISYSNKDEEFTKRLHSRLRDAHIRIWFAPEDIKGGQKVYEQIETAIRYHDKLLLVLSENSMQSEWVITEIRNARRAEAERKRRKLFPIRLVGMEEIQKWTCFDADYGKDLAIEVREYFIPDFSNWKDHDSFEKAFDRLLRDLKAEEK